MDRTNTPIASPPRILSLGKAPLLNPRLFTDRTADGGGIRGISSLLILEDIMQKIREAKGLDHVPRPCEHFDLIGGTSTGGYDHTSLCAVQLLTDTIGSFRSCSEG